MVILSFLGAILAGTVLLSLPIATRGGVRMPLVDALFTATSATCVTGLVVRDTGTFFTGFGRWVIFSLFQIGGLGIMTFSTLFAVMLGRKISLTEQDTIMASLNKYQIVGLKKLITYIIGITLAFESVGALCLFLRWRATTDWPLVETIQNAVFHSVSAFCNAGFALFRTSFMQFEGDPFINLTMVVLIITGGIGFVVILDIIRRIFKRGAAGRMSLQAKIAITTSLVLIIAGAALLLVFEKDSIMRGMTLPQRAWGSVFQSVTARTAGFNTLPIEKLTVPSLLFIAFLMFVGASPGSTGGGIKTCTFAVVVFSLISMMKNRKRPAAFGRSIPGKVIRESLIIFFLSTVWVFAFTIIVSYFQIDNGGVRMTFQQLLFEVTSAFGTVGLSTGITPQLDIPGKICIIATMFAGRIGPLTLALAVAFGESTDKLTFPEESLMVG